MKTHPNQKWKQLSRSRIASSEMGKVANTSHGDPPMTRSTSVLILAIWLFCSAQAWGQNASKDDVKTAMCNARQSSWQLAMIAVDSLKKGNLTDFPGIRAWLDDFDDATQGIDPDVSPDKWPPVNVDALLTNNPNFWQAYYEIAPGDPGLNLLHGGLLLSVGESTRGSYIVAIAHQRPGIPAALQQAFEGLLINSQVFSKASNDCVNRGIALHDKGDYPGALKEYQSALDLWPQNGLAHYEIGYSLRQQQTVAAGKKKLPLNKIIVNAPQNPPEIDAAFAKARKYDPFQFMAYQGTDPEVIRGLLALSKKGLPAWQNVKTHLHQQVDDQVLEDLAEACQIANSHDLALVTRQILVARNKRYSPLDHPFFTTSLRKLAPGQQVEDILQRLDTGTIKAKQIVIPEVDDKP